MIIVNEAIDQFRLGPVQDLYDHYVENEMCC